ncbi:unnamed protein product [Rotaria sordida]|uniref:SH2 domain-containing protein n=1 Tax=Rotaria sordida TaxID=392033 RepID=A0A814CZR0_9BILA|nr:unnamed protein product [Rotaria sordida]CAF1124473.1 unnamed protein product [Rotaria sordida]CAF1343782.1 unnamed protein product [Rotaria sordida]CAF3522489.1 unnamed protein product [Rotaria sordida]
MTYSNNLPISTRFLQQQQQQPLLLVTEEAEILDIDNQNDNDKLLLPRSTRSLKRRTTLFEKSRDWARRLITLHRARRNAISNEKIRETCYESNIKHSIRKNSYHESLYNYPKNFDEDGYLSPMEIQAKLDNISQQNHSSCSKSSNNSSDQQLIVYSHSGSDLAQSIYRCHGPIIQSSTSPCTCQQQQRLPSSSFVSEFHKSLSIVDYIDFDVSETSTSSKQDDDNNDPVEYLKYLFNENNKKEQEQHGNFIRRTPRRSTNTSSISADSGYYDISIPSSKLIPVHLISCTLIPVNVTRTKSMDIHCLACTCPSSTYFSNKTERRRRRKSSTYSSHSHPHRTYSRQHMDILENEISNHCTCNNKYYSTMTIFPTLSVSSPMGTISTTKIDVNNKDDYYNKQQQQKRHLKKKRTSLLKLPTLNDDLTSVSRWYKPNLERDAVCQALQSADYGAFILRNSTTHLDCYALSVKVPKFTHESNIAHYLIERIVHNDSIGYRIKGTMKQFPTLLSLLTHHSVMPEILPITLNLNEILSI